MRTMTTAAWTLRQPVETQRGRKTSCKPKMYFAHLTKFCCFSLSKGPGKINLKLIAAWQCKLHSATGAARSGTAAGADRRT